MTDDSSAPVTPETAALMRDMSRVAQEQCEQLLYFFTNTRRETEGQHASHFAVVVNAEEFALLVRFELAVIIEDIVTPRGALRANFYGRMLLLTVYESALSLRSVIGPNVRSAMRVGAPSVDLDADLKLIHSRVNKLADRCRKDYGDIRTGIVAHRDQNAETRMQLIEKIGGSHVIDLAIELQAILTTLLPIMHTFWQTALHTPEDREPLQAGS